MSASPSDSPALLAARAQVRAQAARGLDSATGRKNLHQLIQLRWIAAFGQIVTIEVAHYGLRLPIPVEPMLAVLAGLLAFNVLSLLRWRTGRRVTNGELFLGLMVDVGTLTAQLHLSGGISNPFVYLYLLQVTLGAVLLRAWAVWTMVAVAIGCVAGLAIFSRPLPVALEAHRGLASPYLAGLLICFALNAVLLVVFITRIGQNLRERDARLAALRQRAAEEEHIVRMGLLASGAAHELGTPLATLAVILGDWQHLPHFNSDPELLQDVTEMQTQVLRCKSIVSGILLSAGETRGESSAMTTVCRFVDDLVADWRSTRSGTVLLYSNRFGHDVPMVSDSSIAQMICNVLDNAREASPQRIHLHVGREDDTLVLEVFDEGPGFRADMLTRLGTPYQSTKGRPGSGLGLFLVVNVARTLGGQVEAANRAEGGALVRITLPLAAVALATKDTTE